MVADNGNYKNIYECDIWRSSSYLSNHGADEKSMSWHLKVQSKTEWKAKL